METVNLNRSLFHLVNTHFIIYTSVSYNFSSKDTEHEKENRANNGKLLRFVEAFRTDGHLVASLDPLSFVDLMERRYVHYSKVNEEVWSAKTMIEKNGMKVG